MNKTRNEPSDGVSKLGAFLEWELTPIKTPFALQKANHSTLAVRSDAVHATITTATDMHPDFVRPLKLK